jgi:hypothetical protein
MKWKISKTFLRAGIALFLLLAATGINACAFPGFGNSASWKEEVLLHDGRKIIVQRSQTHGGRGEIGQSPIKEHSITFTLPGSKEVITWKDEFTQDVGRANFKLLALHILNDTPYIVASANLCLSYNKWGRPNPPYVIFKYDWKEWQRIPLSELPMEFKDINMAIDTINDEKQLVKQELVSAEMIKKLNSEFSKYPNINPPYITIIRKPLVPGSIGVSCEEMVPDGENGWVGFNVSSMHSYEECIKVCKFQNLKKQYCPCDDLLKTKPEWR